jgi:hypothetical protein
MVFLQGVKVLQRLAKPSQKSPPFAMRQECLSGTACAAETGAPAID